MKYIRTIVAMLVAVVFAATVNAQTVVRSLDDVNVPSTNKNDTSSTGNATSGNYSQEYKSKSSSPESKDIYNPEFFALGVGYDYWFTSTGGGMHGLAVSFRYNLALDHWGMYAGFQYAPTFSVSDAATIAHHAGIIDLHASFSCPFSKQSPYGFYLHAGPGMYFGGFSVDSKSPYISKKMFETDRNMDFVLGFGVGANLNKIIIDFSMEIGFVPIYKDSKTTNRELNVSLFYRF